jgi:hypothetical protein
MLGYLTHCRAQKRCIESNSSLCSLCQAVQPVSNFDKIRVIAGTFLDHSSEFDSESANFKILDIDSEVLSCLVHVLIGVAPVS